MLFYATFRLYNLLVLFFKKQYANNGILSLCAFRINVIQNGMYGGVGAETMKIGGKCLL